MTPTYRRAFWAALTVLGISAFATGCELIASVDRDQIPGPDASTGAGGSSAGAGGTPGAGGDTMEDGATTADSQGGSAGEANPDGGDATTVDVPAIDSAPDVAPQDTGVDLGTTDQGVDAGTPVIDAPSGDGPDARLDVTTDSAVALEAASDAREAAADVQETSTTSDAEIEAAADTSVNDAGNDVVATADAGEDAAADAEAGDGA